MPIDSVRRLSPEENSRRGDEPALKESLDENQQFKPIVVNVREGTRYGDRTVLAGNHTHEVAEGMGETEISAVFVHVDDEAAWKIILADNRQGIGGEGAALREEGECAWKDSNLRHMV